MAQRVITQLVDDLDGSDLADGGQTVFFALDGKSYEIDLSEKNAAKLRDSLTKYIQAGRRLSGSRGTTRRSTSSGSSNAKEIRQWAQDQGLDVPTRGRIPALITEAYESAH